MNVNNFTTAQLKAFSVKAKIDIGVIEETMINDKTKYAGCESSSPEGEQLQRVSDYIKNAYGQDVSPTIDGMEGFVDALKKGLKAVVEALKGKPNKQTLALIKKHGYEAEKAIELYNSTKWLEDQTFINIGFVKFQTPGVFNEIKTPDEYKKIIKDILNKCQQDHNKIIKNTEQRLNNGLKIYNQFAKKDYDEDDFEKLKKLLPIKPDIIPVNKDTYLDLIGKGWVHNSVPVLTKDQVKEMTGVMKELSTFVWGLATKRENLVADALDYNDLYDEFWGKVPDKELNEMVVAVEWHAIDSKSLDPFSDPVEKIMVELLKFLENWILYSVK